MSEDKVDYKTGSIFKKLNSFNMEEYIQKKKNLDYISWANAWSELKKLYPEANYQVHVNETGMPYFESSLGYMVKVSVTIENLTHTNYLPVLDGANKPMKLEAYEYTTKYGKKTCEAIDIFHVNTAIMRCLTKAIAMHGLGLSLYRGEDLQNGDEMPQKSSNPTAKPTSPPKTYTNAEERQEARTLINAIIHATGKTEFDIIQEAFIWDTYPGDASKIVSLEKISDNWLKKSLKNLRSLYKKEIEDNINKDPEIPF